MDSKRKEESGVEHNLAGVAETKAASQEVDAW